MRQDTSLPQISSINTLVDVSSVGFEWNPILDSSIKGFIVYRSNSASQNDLVQIAVIENRFATHFYDKNLKPQSTYTYAFATFGDDDNISLKSEPITVKTSFIDAVESVFAINNQPRVIKLIWSPHPNPSVESYFVERLNKNGEFSSVAATSHRFDVEFFDTDLNDGQTYTYRVIAQSFDGVKSKPSQSISVSTIPQPEAISGISASDGLPRAIEITWEEAPDTKGVKEKHYKILYGKKNHHYKVLATTNKTSYTHKIKEDGESYYYQVVLLGENGLEGKMSNETIKGSSLPPPLMPKAFSGTITNGKAELKWETPNDVRIKGYVVYREESGVAGLFGKSLRFGNITDNMFIDKEMKKGKTYKYSVASIDEYGIESAPTKEVHLSTP